MNTDELRPIDADHFWIGELMVDLVQLQYEANSVLGRKNLHIGQIHDIKSALLMLAKYATYLSEPGHKYRFLATPENVKKYLRMANNAGLHTGYSEERRTQ